jgi:Lectin C-type domain/PEP-CTERM motif
MKTKRLIKHLTLLLAVIATCFVPLRSHATTPGILDSAVFPGNGHLYYLLDNSNWSDAQTTAVGLGGNLTTINDLTENNWIWDRWGTNRDLWIGLYDPVIGDGGGATHAANFTWVDGSASAYRNWRPGEPNNANNDYYTYILAKGLDGGGQWNDISDFVFSEGQYPLYGVVEVVPEPSSSALIVVGILGALWAKRKNIRR